MGDLEMLQEKTIPAQGENTDTTYTELEYWKDEATV